MQPPQETPRSETAIQTLFSIKTATGRPGFSKAAIPVPMEAARRRTSENVMEHVSSS